MKRRLSSVSWGVVGVVGVVDVVDEVPDLFIMIILKRRVGCSTNHFFRCASISKLDLCQY